MVGDGDPRLEEAGEHLAPTVVRLDGQIGGSGIAGDVEGGDTGVFDFDAADGGMRIGEFERDALVPSPGLAAWTGGGADVDQKA